MCGIIGIIGTEPAAPQLVDALKRLEYRGYDSAGVATLEGGQLTRRRAEGKLQESGEEAVGASRSPARSASAIPAGRRMAGRPRTTRIRMRPRSSPSCTTASSRIFAELRARARGQGREIFHRDRHRSRRASRHRGNEARRVAGRRGQGGAAAPARRLRARLPVRRRGRSSDRRAARLAACGRLRRRCDVCRLRRDRARAVHRHCQLSRRRRLGRARPQGRRDPRRRRQGRRARDVEVASLRHADRQGQPSPLHGEGDFRAARSRRPHACQLHRHGGRRASRCR